jgi:hypothetical protein
MLLLNLNFAIAKGMTYLKGSESLKGSYVAFL